MAFLSSPEFWLALSQIILINIVGGMYLGVVEHDLIWGIFTFGGRYGGTFMRAKAVGLSDGIVNTASGAMELLLYEGGD